MCFRPPTIEGGKVKCPKCGAEAPMEATTCPNCGATSGVNSVAPPPPVPAGGIKAPGRKVPGAPKVPGK